ncbi:tetratricopeptide repeat protein [Mangrovihabitans endophyticus]|uniref:ATP-binding protein n=1 Tax=Mangrovihabitans endophyticus TaxID=1751298 RepID=A0A8J3BWK9_9ACTN|nr:tetratricopeptide repeat protein [Mangrovihabitans endophyticus]GGK74978.1 ATP-binding protein [Mangrovihabitans endophyticus]
MRKASRSVTLLLSVTAALLLPMATNVATGTLPVAWQPYLWLSWPAAALLCALVVIAELRHRWPMRGRAAGRVVPAAARDGTAWNIPGGVPSFTGRVQALHELHILSMRPEPGIAVLTGLAGVGKTELACAHAAARRGSYDIGWWVAADSRLAVLASLAQLADRLGVSDGDQEIAALRAMHELGRRGRWLLVFDDVIREKDVSHLIPAGSGQVLITSRDPNLGRLGTAIEVQPLDDDSAARLLMERTGGQDVGAATELAQELGGLPLALEQAAAYCRSTGIEVSGYLPRYRQNCTRLLRQGNPADRLPVQATLFLAVAQARRRERAAVELLSLCAFFAPVAGIPRWLIESDPALLSPRLARTASDVFALDTAVAVLVRLSLVQADRDLLRVHPVVQDVIRDRLAQRRTPWPAPGRYPPQRWIRMAAGILVAALPSDVNAPSTWDRWVLAVPHCTRVAEHATAWHVRGTVIARLRHRLGKYLLSRGDYAHAGPLLESAVIEHQAVAGADHPETLAAMNDHARLLVDTGRLDEGLRLHEAALRARHRILGPVHSDTLISMNNRAFVLDRLGRSDEARRLHEEVLRIRRRTLGENHPNTLISKGNLALVLAGQGELRQARELHAQSYAARCAVLGPEHPRTLVAQNNLAIVVSELGDLQQALRTHEAVYAGWLKLYGPEHPETLMSINNRGYLLFRLGRLQEARDLLEPNAQLRARIFGSGHPHTLMSRNNLAVVLVASGQIDRAVAEHQEVLRLREWTLGHRHPYTLHSQNNLAVALAACGRMDAAAELHVRTRQTRRETLGDEHPCTLNSSHNLALVRAGEGRIGEAGPLLEETLEVRRRRLGPAHPYTRNSTEALEYIGKPGYHPDFAEAT